MTIQETKKKLKAAGITFSAFLKWMMGQTVGIYPNGETDFYDYDVNRFIRYKGNSENESIGEFD